MAAVVRSGENKFVTERKPLPQVPSPKVKEVRALTENEQTRIASKVQNLVDAEANLAAVERKAASLAIKKAKLEEQEKGLEEQSKASAARIEASDARIVENRREAVRTILSKNVLGVQKEELTKAFAQSDLDKISCELKTKKCLIADVAGVQDVILPFLKSKSISTVNLSFFKDEITPKAVITFFQGLMETKVSTVILGKNLTAEETAAKQVAVEALAKLGRQLSITVKAA